MKMLLPLAAVLLSPPLSAGPFHERLAGALANYESEFMKKDGVAAACGYAVSDPALGRVIGLRLAGGGLELVCFKVEGERTLRRVAGVLAAMPVHGDVLERHGLELKPDGRRTAVVSTGAGEELPPDQLERAVREFAERAIGMMEAREINRRLKEAHRAFPPFAPVEGGGE